MRWKIPALFVGVFLLAGLAVAGGDKNKAAQKALQGSWTAVKGDEKFKMSFEGNKWKLEFKGETANGTFTIDASKAPNQMDLAVVKGSGDNTMKFEGKTSKAIFAIEGTKLKWLANEPGRDERPDAFPKDGDSPKHLYVVFERDKK